MNFQFFMPSRLLFGPGKLAELATTEFFPGTKAMIVIGAGGAMVRNGYVDKVRELLKARGVDSVVYDKIRPNPLSGHIDEAAGIANAQGCDVIIGLGGGSSVDAAKGIALVATNGGSYWDYMPGGSGGNKPVTKPALPIVAIPTTAGTGTETDSWAVISKTDGSEKIDWGHDTLYPTLSITDPELTLTMPAHQTAYTGMDALFHAVEGYLSNARQPISDLLSLEAVSLVGKWLPVAIKEPGNLEARTMLSWASAEAGICESLAGCISHHSMEHAVSAFYPDVAHGAGLTMLSLSYFGFLAERCEPERFVNLAKALGEDVTKLPSREQPMAFVHALKKLIASVGIQTENLAAYGVKAADIPAMAENALATNAGGFELTPYRLSTQDICFIYEKALNAN